MGVLVIDTVARIDLRDDLLEHVFAVIVAKLRRHEPVVLSWSGDGGQAQQVFVTPTSTLHAEYDSASRGGLERDRLEPLMLAANSMRGLALDELGAVRAPAPLRPAAVPA